MRALKFIDRLLARMEGWLVVFFLSLMIGLTFFQVILRALYTYGYFHWANMVLGRVDWTEPLVRVLVLWLTFLGASLLTDENKHIKIDLMTNLLPPRFQPFRSLILSIACTIIGIIMILTSIEYIKLEIDFGGTLFLLVPTWIGQLILPMGFFVITFRFILQGIEQVSAILGKREL